MALTLENTIPQYSFADNPIWVIVASDQYTGDEPPFVPIEFNQRVVMLVEYEQPAGTFKSASLSLAISPFTKLAYANVAATLNIPIGPPNDTTIINPTIAMTAESKGWAKYTVSAFEQSGIPPEVANLPSLELGIEPLLYAIKGGLPLDAVDTINQLNTTTTGKLLHLLLGNIYQDTLPITDFGDLIIRPATKEQPSWMYIFSLGAETFTAKITVGFSNGATVVHTIAGITAVEGINYLPVGWNQLDLDTSIVGPAGEKAEFYSITLEKAAADVGFTMFFQLHECQPTTRYLLMETGLGGFETVPLFGKHSYGVESSRETTRMSTTPNTTSDTGTYANLNTQTNRIITSRTGYYSKNYIEMLAQLLCGELWEIDLVGERFLKIAADQTSFRELYKEDADLYALEFKYRQGWDDPHSLKI